MKARAYKFGLKHSTATDSW